MTPPAIDRCQRWELGRASYRPAREVIDPRRLDVAEIEGDATAKAFVETHHYSRTYPAARFRFALYDRGELAGVAVFSRPYSAETITNTFPLLSVDEGVELGRFVLLDRIGANGETWFLARCFELLGDRVAGVVSFSDPWPRTAVGGAIVFPGHIGTIYQAKGARYGGLSDPSSRWILPDGTEFSNFANGKIRRKLTGWRSSAAKLERFGAPPLAPIIDDVRARIEWLETWRSRLTRTFRHHGNHRYTWLLDRRAARAYGPERAYPKARAA